MGGYLPVSVSGTGAARYPAPEGCLLSPVAVSAKPLLPLKRATVTSIFGYRIHPITGELDFHTGLDLAAAQGLSLIHISVKSQVEKEKNALADIL